VAVWDRATGKRVKRLQEVTSRFARGQTCATLWDRKSSGPFRRNFKAG
jgi:hypothetical protein